MRSGVRKTDWGCRRWLAAFSRTGFYLGLVLLGVGLLYPGGAAGEKAAYGEVRVNRANVRKAPDKHSRKLFSLRRHARVKIVREQGDWFYITDSRGRRGWLFNTLVRFLQLPRVKPEIRLFWNRSEPGRKPFFSRLVAELREDLAGPEKRQLELEVTWMPEPGAGRAGRGQESWVLALKVPFRRREYCAQSGAKAAAGTVDLLPFQAFLGAMLNCRDRFLAEIEKHPAVWQGGGRKDCRLPLVEVLVVLESPAGDRVVLSGRREHGLPVFNDYILLDMHGFSPFSLSARIPASVSDFNLFVLPPAFLADGSRSQAALAYDFFGLDY